MLRGPTSEMSMRWESEGGGGDGGDGGGGGGGGGCEGEIAGVGPDESDPSPVLVRGVSWWSQCVGHVRKHRVLPAPSEQYTELRVIMIISYRMLIY